SLPGGPMATHAATSIWNAVRGRYVQVRPPAAPTCRVVSLKKSTEPVAVSGRWESNPCPKRRMRLNVLISRHWADRSECLCRRVSEGELGYEPILGAPAIGCLERTGSRGRDLLPMQRQDGLCRSQEQVIPAPPSHEANFGRGLAQICLKTDWHLS